MTKHLKTVNLYGVAMLLLMTACSPKVVTHISKVYPDIIPTDSVYVIELGDKVPNTAETIGRISVVDRGTSSKCRYIWRKKLRERMAATDLSSPTI